MIFVRDFLADQQVFRRPEAPPAPAVSVVLPTFQRRAGGLLQLALDSVLSQSFGDLELIVVDDGSVDGTFELIQALQREDPRVVHVRHELNCGLPALRVNEGIELARGRWIAFQFDDDEWLAGGLAALVEATRAAPEPSVVFGRASWVSPTWRNELPRVPVDLRTLTRQNEIANNSVLVPRRLLELRGLYDPHVGMRRLCDWDLWLRLIAHAPFVPADRLVSRVPFVSDPTAIGVTTPLDLPLVRYLMSIRRDEVLGLDRWRDYEVDGLGVAGVEVPGVLRDRLERDQLRPFRARLRHAFPRLADDRAASSSSPRVFLCAADEREISLDLCLGSYDALCCRRGEYKQVFHPVRELCRENREGIGLLLFFRTSSPTAGGIAGEEAAGGRPVACYLDGDLFPHEQLAAVDAVWAVSPEVNEAVRLLNPRLVPHNGAVPESWLPRTLLPRGSSGRLRVGCLGTACKREDLAPLWGALQTVAERWGDRLELEFWGVEVGDLPPLASPVVQRPFTDSIGLFIERLRHGRLDVLLAPLSDGSWLAEPPSQYSLTAVAGALGIFSGVPPYDSLPDGISCLKPANAPAAWEAAIEEALTMPAERFDAMRRAMVEHVRLEYTAEAQIHLHEAACRATVLHAATRRHRIDGRPRVLYLFAPGAPPALDRELLRAARLARDYGIEPRGPVAPQLLGTARPEGAVAPLRAILEAERPARVHASAPFPAAAALCAELGIPLAVTPPEWRSAPPEAFAGGLRRVLSGIAGLQPPGTPPRVALLGDLTAENGQLVAIQAVAALPRDLRLCLELWGGEASDPTYADRCWRRIWGLRLEERVKVLRHSEDPDAVLRRSDLLLDLSGGEGLSEWVALAMASGVPVLACEGSVPAAAEALAQALRWPASRRAAAAAAGYRWARGELHPQRRASRLLALYDAASAARPR